MNIQTSRISVDEAARKVDVETDSDVLLRHECLRCEVGE